MKLEYDGSIFEITEDAHARASARGEPVYVGGIGFLRMTTDGITEFPIIEAKEAADIEKLDGLALIEHSNRFFAILEGEADNDVNVLLVNGIVVCVERWNDGGTGILQAQDYRRVFLHSGDYIGRAD